MLRVLIADDNAVIRQGLAALLEAAGDIAVAGQAATGKEAVALARELRPDVAMLDVRMPVQDGLTAAETVAKHTRVLMLTYADDEATVTGAIRAGASGYLVHGRFTPEELDRAVRDVAAGQTVLSPVAAAIVFGALRRADRPLQPPSPTELTERECEIMALVARGVTNGDIAGRLFLSEKTVKNHLNRIYAKLGVTRRAEAIAHWLGVAAADGHRQAV